MFDNLIVPSKNFSYVTKSFGMFKKNFSNVTNKTFENLLYVQNPFWKFQIKILYVQKQIKPSKIFLNIKGFLDLLAWISRARV